MSLINLDSSQYIKPVSSEDEAKAFINEIKQQHKEVTHNCSAYTVGDQMNIQKANDDGEPSGTAGVPMLEILKKLDVHNVCVVVTRYFGVLNLAVADLYGHIVVLLETSFMI